MLISGDVHYGEIITDPCTEHLQGYVVKEFTSSGLSHADGDWPYIGSLYYYEIMLKVGPQYSVASRDCRPKMTDTCTEIMGFSTSRLEKL